MPAVNFEHFGGQHSESAALKNLLAHAGVATPLGGPFGEALCFAVAGGIGAGYSFCPSVIKHGCGSGVAIVGRHRIYATGASWYQDFFDRLGIRTQVTESAGTGKAYRNLLAELEAGRPAVVWCSGMYLPFLGRPVAHTGLCMHTFVVHAVDEPTGFAHSSDCAAGPVTLTLAELEKARNGVCSHKNRTLTFDPPRSLTPETLRSALRAGLKACVQELTAGKMKTYSLPGLEMLAKAL